MELVKPIKTKPLKRFRGRLEGNIRVVLKEISDNTRNWVDSPQYRDCWRSLVNAVLWSYCFLGRINFKMYKIVENMWADILFTLYSLTPWLMEPGGSMPHSQALSNNSYPEPNQSIPRIDTHFFKIHSNMTLLSTPRPS